MEALKFKGLGSDVKVLYWLSFNLHRRLSLGLWPYFRFEDAFEACDSRIVHTRSSLKVAEDGLAAYIDSLGESYDERLRAISEQFEAVVCASVVIRLTQLQHHLRSFWPCCFACCRHVYRSVYCCK